MITSGNFVTKSPNVPAEICSKTEDKKSGKLSLINLQFIDNHTDL